MFKNWYLYLIIAVVAALFEWLLGKFKLVKSKDLRYILAFILSALICWNIYDYLIAGK